MYLHQEMETMDGKFRKLCGVIPGKAFRTPKLNRFGYITLTEKEDTGLGEIPAHEFHYFDSTNCGEDFHAAKPASKRGWDCIHKEGLPDGWIPPSLLLWKSGGSGALPQQCTGL